MVDLFLRAFLKGLIKEEDLISLFLAGGCRISPGNVIKFPPKLEKKLGIKSKCQYHISYFMAQPILKSSSQSKEGIALKAVLEPFVKHNEFRRQLNIQMQAKLLEVQ